jgi:two-component system sensor histidine kinase VanS
LNNWEKKKWHTTLSGKIFRRFFWTLAAYTIALFLAYMAVFYYLTRKLWFGDELLYPLFHAINRHKAAFCIGVWLLGFFLVFFYYWKKTLSYLDVMAEAGNRLISDDEEFIHLPQELKEVEEQMNRVKSESMKNARAAAAAEQRKNDLIVYLAHDLKTPLTSVIGYLSLLRDEREISEELREKYLAVALEKAERLEDLINEFFEITRFNLTHLTLEKECVNFTRMLEQMVFEFRPMFLEKKISHEAEIEPGLSLVCDVDKMERVFDNLLKNAVNYTEEHGKIFVKAGKKKGENAVQIVVRNTGKTIPKEKLDRIFEQFFRLDSARTSSSGGAGLGLAIAKEIVELHGGRIWAVSEEGMVEFWVEVPMEGDFRM